ncbi:MAG: hypothetical protein C0469_07220 [Cyanobacteria bacterium DS2.3.42]|nr:hypothetical protein [Cyanobacteria bacterium DS2.3.42]
MTKILKSGVIVLLFVLALNGAAESVESKNETIDAENIRFFVPWTPVEKVHLTVKVKSSSKTEDALSVLSDDKTICKYHPTLLSLISAFILDDGNLGTLWVEGIGNLRHLVVFSYSKGKVFEVLHTVSNGLNPEFAYQSGGLIMHKNTEKDGNYLRQRIIVPNTELVQEKSEAGALARERRHLSLE